MHNWFKAITVGDLNLIRNYISNGFDINCNLNEYSNNALIIACYYKHLDVVKEL